MQFRCDNRTLGGVVQLPDGYRIIAIDCGTNDPGHEDKFSQASRQLLWADCSSIALSAMIDSCQVSGTAICRGFRLMTT